MPNNGISWIDLNQQACWGETCEADFWGVTDPEMCEACDKHSCVNNPRHKDWLKAGGYREQ